MWVITVFFFCLTNWLVLYHWLHWTRALCWVCVLQVFLASQTVSWLSWRNSGWNTELLWGNNMHSHVVKFFYITKYCNHILYNFIFRMCVYMLWPHYYIHTPCLHSLHILLHLIHKTCHNEGLCRYAIAMCAILDHCLRSLRLCIAANVLQSVIVYLQIRQIVW